MIITLLWCFIQISVLKFCSGYLALEDCDLLDLTYDFSAETSLYWGDAKFSLKPVFKGENIG